MPDVKDGWPEDADYAPPVMAAPGYVVVPLPSNVYWSAINERASVAGTSTRGAEFWKNGERRLMVPEGVTVAMNDRDEVLVRYFRPPLAHEYDVNVARWAWTEAWTRSFIAAPTPVGQITDLFYPAAASEPQVPVIFESTPLAVEVFGVWSPQNGLHELSTVVDVASDGRWPRWTNGSKLFTIDAKWICLLYTSPSPRDS